MVDCTPNQAASSHHRVRSALPPHHAASGQTIAQSLPALGAPVRSTMRYHPKQAHPSTRFRSTENTRLNIGWLVWYAIGLQRGNSCLSSLPVRDVSVPKEDGSSIAHELKRGTIASAVFICVCPSLTLVERPPASLLISDCPLK